MADLYWVGGAGIWNGQNTASWSLEPSSSRSYPGNAGRIPLATDNVFFDQYSGGGAITVAGGAILCYNFNSTGFTGYFRGSGAGYRNIEMHGTSITIGCSFYSGGLASSVGINYVAVTETTTLTVTNSGFAIREVIVNAVGSTLNLASNVNTRFTHHQGTLNGNGYGTVPGYGSYSSPNTVTGASRIFNMGSGTWKVNYWQVLAADVDLVLNKDTATIEIVGSSEFYFGGRTYNKLKISSSGPFQSTNILGGGTFSEISRVRTGSPSNIAFDTTTATNVGTLSVIGDYINPGGAQIGGVDPTGAGYFVGDWQFNLVSSIDDSQTTGVAINGAPTDGQYTFVAMPVPGSIKIGSEVISYTNYTWNGSNQTTLTGVTRGVNGTVKGAHTTSEIAYVPYYLNLISTTPGVQATVNITTPNGTLYAGINSVTLGNNTGTIVYNSAAGNMDYVGIRDINFNIIPDPTVSARFFAFR